MINDWLTEKRQNPQTNRTDEKPVDNTCNTRLKADVKTKLPSCLRTTIGWLIENPNPLDKAEHLRQSLTRNNDPTCTPDRQTENPSLSQPLNPVQVIPFFCRVSAQDKYSHWVCPYQYGSMLGVPVSIWTTKSMPLAYRAMHRQCTTSSTTT